jgi:hypothetical protein
MRNFTKNLVDWRKSVIFGVCLIDVKMKKLNKGEKMVENLRAGRLLNVRDNAPCNFAEHSVDDYPLIETHKTGGTSMRRKFPILMIMLLVITALTAACNSDKLHEEVDINDPIWYNPDLYDNLYLNLIALPANPITHDYSFVWNTNNPHDSIGFLHNEALDYYVTHANMDASFSTLDDTVEYMHSVMAEFFNTIEFEQISAGETYAALNNLFNVYPQQSTSFRTFYHSALSSSLANAIDTLYDILLSNTLNPNANTICSAVKQLENNVAVSSMAANDKNIFFAASAIMKFSATYWLEVGNGVGAASYWGDNRPVNRLQLSDKAKDIICAAVDVAVYVAYVCETGGWWTGLGVATAGSALTKALITLGEAVGGWIVGLFD